MEKLLSPRDFSIYLVLDFLVWMKQSTILSPRKHRIYSGTNCVFQRFPQHSLLFHMFFLQFAFDTPIKRWGQYFFPLTVSGFLWLFQLQSAGEIMLCDFWSEILGGNAASSFWNAVLYCETCSHHVHSPVVLRPLCCEASPHGKALRRLTT